MLTDRHLRCDSGECCGRRSCHQPLMEPSGIGAPIHAPTGCSLGEQYTMKERCGEEKGKFLFPGKARKFASQLQEGDCATLESASPQILIERAKMVFDMLATNPPPIPP